MQSRKRVRFPPYAEAFFCAPARYRILYGGRGAGRSWTVARKLLVRAGAEPIRILCAREMQSSIRDSVYRLLIDQAERLGLPGFEATRDEIRHTGTGSLFIFEGLRHNVTKIKSMEGIDVAWVEEAERVSEESWNVLIPTIRKPGSEIVVTFNPDQETDPTYRRFVIRPPPDSVVLRVSSADNPWLPQVLRAERDYLYRVDPDAAAHVWGGECRTATDAQVLRGKWVVEEFDPAPDWNPLHGADFGFAQDPTTLLRCYVQDRVLYISHEAYKIGLELDDTPAHWARHVPGAADYVIRADSARPESISYLRRHGVPRIASVAKWNGSVADGIAHLRQYERIVIHPRCKHTADEARHYSYKVDARTGDVLPQIVDANNHCLDALRYALEPLIRRKAAPFAFSL